MSVTWLVPRFTDKVAAAFCRAQGRLNRGRPGLQRVTILAPTALLRQRPSLLLRSQGSLAQTPRAIKYPRQVAAERARFGVATSHFNIDQSTSQVL